MEKDVYICFIQVCCKWSSGWEFGRDDLTISYFLATLSKLNFSKRGHAFGHMSKSKIWRLEPVLFI